MKKEEFYFAVLDTETNWHDQVMSMGIVISDRKYRTIDYRYFILAPEYTVGGMFSDTLFLPEQYRTERCGRKEAVAQTKKFLNEYGVEDIFAYNARFDKGHLPELSEYRWYDIMRLAAYRQYNPYIPTCAEVCATGRLKRGYGAEAVLRMIGENNYNELHNALTDSVDELKIMERLGHSYEVYAVALLK